MAFVLPVRFRRFRCFGLLFCLLAAAWVPALPTWADDATPVAQLLQVRPLIRLVRGKGKRDARSLDTLRVGDHLVFSPKGGTTLVFYATGQRFQINPSKDGAEIEIKANNTLGVVRGAKPQELRKLNINLVRAIGNATGQNKHIGPQFGGQVIRGGARKGGVTDFLFPVAAPVFLPENDVIVRWRSGTRTADQVSVSVFRLLPTGGKDGAALDTKTVEATSSEVVFAASLFSPGARYRIVFDDGPAPLLITFTILTEAEGKEITSMASELRVLPRIAYNDTTPELLAALLFESNDLQENARTAYTDARRRNPADDMAKQWLERFAP